MTWWQILLAIAAAVWLYDRLTDRGAPADRLAWWHEKRRRPPRHKLSKADRASPSPLHMPMRAPGVDDAWAPPPPVDPHQEPPLGPEHPVKRRDLPDDTPEWLADAFDLAGVNGMLADLRGQQAWPAPFLGIAVQDLQRSR